MTYVIDITIIRMVRGHVNVGSISVLPYVDSVEVYNYLELVDINVANVVMITFHVYYFDIHI